MTQRERVVSALTGCQLGKLDWKLAVSSCPLLPTYMAGKSMLAVGWELSQDEGLGTSLPLHGPLPRCLSFTQHGDSRVGTLRRLSRSARNFHDLDPEVTKQLICHILLAKVVQSSPDN